MTAQLSPRHDDDGPPSTQFAATEQGFPVDAPGFPAHDPDAPDPHDLDAHAPGARSLTSRDRPVGHHHDAPTPPERTLPMAAT